MRPHRFLAAGCAAAGLALCAGLPASAAAASSAPVVHESFTLLPCPSQPRTSTQIEGCAEHKVIAADKTIDSLNAKAYAKLKSAGRADFAATNKQWVAYRDEACTAESSIYAGGSVQPVAYANCLLAIDTSHIGELKTMLVALRPSG